MSKKEREKLCEHCVWFEQDGKHGICWAKAVYLHGCPFERRK